jgi:superfamily II DNA or RNA helicase
MPQREGRTVFRILGYAQFAKLIYDDPELLQDKYVIVDEAHHYRNVTNSMLADLDALALARNVFFLSGTPLQGSIEEAYGVVKMFEPEINDPSIVTPKLMREIMQNKVSYYDPRVHDEEMMKHYPSVETIIKYIPMDWDQTFEYLISMRKDFTFGDVTVSRAIRNAYDSQTKLISNSISDNYIYSPKYNAIISDVIANAKPCVVYSYFLKRGVMPMRELLLERQPKTKTDLLDGAAKTDTRKKIIDNYNSNKTQVQFLTDAAREGVDLHNTRYIYMTEPCQNKEEEAQTIGRVVRYNSHKHSEVKKVIVVKYLSVFPKKMDNETARRLNTAMRERFGIEMDDDDFRDEMMEKIAQQKRTVDEKIEQNNIDKYNKIQEYLNVLKEIGKPRWDIHAKRKAEELKLAKQQAKEERLAEKARLEEEKEAKKCKRTTKKTVKKTTKRKRDDEGDEKPKKKKTASTKEKKVTKRKKVDEDEKPKKKKTPAKEPVKKTKKSDEDENPKKRTRK